MSLHSSKFYWYSLCRKWLASKTSPSVYGITQTVYRNRSIIPAQRFYQCMVYDPIHPTEFCLSSSGIAKIIRPTVPSVVDYRKLLNVVSQRQFSSTNPDVPSSKGKYFLYFGLLCGAFYWLKKKHDILSLSARWSLAQAEIAILNGNPSKAEQHIINAAWDTETRFSQKSLNMLYMVDRIAKFYCAFSRFNEAEINFKRCLAILLSLEYSQTNPGVITTSLSLADIYLTKGDLKMAKTGYDWCLEKAQLAIKEGEEEKVTLETAKIQKEILALCQDRQAKILCEIGTPMKAIEVYESDTKNRELTASVLYNLGCLEFHLGHNLKSARRTLQMALEEAILMKDNQQVASVKRVLNDINID